VASAGSLLSGVLSPETLMVQGPAVEWQWYRDREHERREVSKAVNRLLGEGFKPAEITILSVRPRERSSLREGLIDVPFLLVDTEDAIALPPEKAIRYATAGDFKGLESKVVLLIDVDTLDDADTLYSLYVGASRAIALLIVFLDKMQEEPYNRRAAAYAEKFLNKPEEAERM
jgi:superfamily I DNA/RNA helicase